MPPSLRPAVLVTGASTGIGRATVEYLVREDCVVLAGVRRREDGEALAALAPEQVHWLELDVTRPDQIAGAVAETAGRLAPSGLRGLVNNAGIALGGPLEYFPPDDLRRQLEVNVVGLHAVTQAFLPLVRRGRGRIVHVGSISGLIASPFIGPYAASKHAVEALADALRLELAPEGIPVAVIEPGQVRTPIWDKGLRQSQAMADRIPAEGLVRYGSRLRAFRWILEQAPRHGLEPGAVAEAIGHALFAPEPRARYVLGKDARVRLFLFRLLPTRAMDALVLRFMARMERRAS
jgi:NAD(P)-dependent dehydrogenase (short-subunit alcohol dehydrogenase family)